VDGRASGLGARILFWQWSKTRYCHSERVNP
jgi:hypothetical protein